MANYDTNLIYIKSENARIPLKELSNQLHKSPQRLKYNLAMLEKEKILEDAFCLFDYSYLGLILFRVYFKGGYIGDTDKAKVLRFLHKNQYVISTYELTGEYDLVVEFACPNPSKFNKELKKTVFMRPTLNDYKIILNLVTYIFPRHFLTRSHMLQSQNYECIIGGDREPETFSKKELLIINALVEKPAGSLTELAVLTGCNPRTIKSTMYDLKKRKIIRGYKHSINCNLMGINSCRLFLKLHNLTIEREDELNKHLLRTREVVQVNKTVGDWDMEIDIESFDRQRTRAIIMRMRNNFKDMIARFNIMEFYDLYKRSYVPGYVQ